MKYLSVALVLMAGPALSATPPSKASKPGDAVPAAESPDLRNLRAMRALEEGCRQGTADVRVLLRQQERPDFLAPLLTPADGVLENELRSYFACASSVSQSKESCDFFKNLEKIPSSRDDYFKCRAQAAYANMAGAVFGRGDAALACRQFQARQTEGHVIHAKTSQAPQHEEMRGEAPSEEVLCRDITAAMRSGQEVSFCRTFRGEEAAVCLSHFVDLQGLPDRCDSAKLSPERRLDCRSKALLVSAAKSGRPQDCGPSLARANKLFCDGVAAAAAEQVKVLQRPKDSPEAKARAQADRAKMDALRDEKTRLARTAEAERIKKADEERLRKDEEQRRANAVSEIQRKMGEESRKKVFKKGEPMHDIAPDVLKKMQEMEDAGRPKANQ